MKLLPTDIVNLSLASIDSIELPLLHNKQVNIDVLRLDKIDPIVSGNKWFKLKYYLQDALESGCSTLLTFGGAWSNHIVAAACATKRAGIQSIGIIRGEEPLHLSPTLQTALSHGMQLQFVSRKEYAGIKKDPSSLLQQFPGAFLVPEGGEGERGTRGASDILKIIDPGKYTHIICAMGTGTMLLGLALGATQQQVIGILVLKGFEKWKENKDLSGFQPPSKKMRIIDGYHFGGYSKKNNELIQFMNWFYIQTGIPSDFVYTGKLFYALMDLVGLDFFPPGSSIIAIHSGGLQGNESLPPQSLQF